MTDTTYRVVGLDKFVRTLRQCSADLGDLKYVHAAVGNIVAGAARGKAPKRSGQLAGTIRASRQARRAQVVAGSRAVPYAGAIHWGWPARGIAAQPFLSDAAQDTESTWLPLYARDLQAAVDKVKGA